MIALDLSISKIRASLFFSVAFAFLFSRLAVLAISFAGYGHFERELPNLSWIHWMGDLWARFDVGWYISVAKDGYENLPFSTEAKHNWGFLPLYPMLLKAFTWLIGMNQSATKFAVIGSLLSSSFSCLALCAIFHTFQDRIQHLHRFLFLYLISAGSFYLSIPYAESLGLLLLAGAFYFTQRKQYLWAALAAGLGAITRLQLLALVFIPLFALIADPEEGRKKIKSLAVCALFSLPTLAHMSYLHSITGNPFAFFDIQLAWGNAAPYPLESLIVFIQRGIHNPPWQWLQFLTWALFGACLMRNYRKLPLNERIFCIAVFVISTGTEQFYGAYRYVLMLIPLYVALTQEEGWFRDLYIYSNLIAGTIYIAAFTNNRIFAL